MTLVITWTRPRNALLKRPDMCVWWIGSLLHVVRLITSVDSLNTVTSAIVKKRDTNGFLLFFTRCNIQYLDMGL